MTSLEDEFLAASEAAEEAGRVAAIRATRRLRRLGVGLAVALIAASVAGGIAAWQWEEALSARSAAVSEQLAAKSVLLAASGNPDATKLAALAAWNAGHTATALSALLSTTAVWGGNVLYLSNADGRIRTWRDLSDPPPTVAVSPRGTSLAVAETDGTVIIYGLPRLTVTQRLRVLGRVDGAAFSPDGALLAIVYRATVSVWDLASGKRLWYYPSRGYLDAVAFSSDGGRVTTVSSQSSVRSWDARTGRQLGGGNLETGSGNAIAVSPDGRLLATAGNDRNIILWDSESLTRVAMLAGSVGPIHSLAFSPNGRLLASGEGNGTILLWDIKSRTWAATLTDRQTDGQAVNVLAFTARNALISGDGSGYIIAWDLNPVEVIRRDCWILAHDPGLAQAETLVPGASYARLCPS
jgi:WD40 repeat protein